MWEVGEDAPTGVAPTELGAAINETEAHTARSHDGGDDWPPRRRLTPGGITVLAVTASLTQVALATLTAFVYLRHREGALSVATPTRAGAPPATSTPPTAAQPAPTPSTHGQPPTPITLLMDRYGSVYLRTVSGRTVCAMTAGAVQCNVDFTKQLGPSNNGMPASGVGDTSQGESQWLSGDPGHPTYTTMTYGTVYRAIGWTVTPTTGGTTFINVATEHGMTISVDGFSTF